MCVSSVSPITCLPSRFRISWSTPLQMADRMPFYELWKDILRMSFNNSFTVIDILFVVISLSGDSVSREITSWPFLLQVSTWQILCLIPIRFGQRLPLLQVPVCVPHITQLPGTITVRLFVRLSSPSQGARSGRGVLQLWGSSFQKLSPSASMYSGTFLFEHRLLSNEILFDRCFFCIGALLALEINVRQKCLVINLEAWV